LRTTDWKAMDKYKAPIQEKITIITPSCPLEHTLNVALIHSFSLKTEVHKMHKLIGFFITCLIVGCAGPTPMPTNEFCNVTETKDSYQKALVFAQEYYDQVQVTASTPKAAMAEEISVLQTVRKNVEDARINQCTAQLYSALINAMNNSIDGFLASVSDQPKSVQDAFFDKGTEFIRQINIEIAKLADCLPNCRP
jgi:hypothetical protein